MTSYRTRCIIKTELRRFGKSKTAERIAKHGDAQYLDRKTRDEIAAEEAMEVFCACGAELDDDGICPRCKLP